MPEAIHQSLANGGWQRLSLAAQLGNVSGEISRTLNWQNKNTAYRDNALIRGFELLNLTNADTRWRRRLKELTRLREVLLDFFYDQNNYGSTEDNLRQYFDHFAYAARLNKL